jgi:hypothetical protein
MGNDPGYRRFYTSQPALRVYDGSTLKRSIVFLQEENDVQASSYHYEMEDDCEPFVADDKTKTVFPAGVRLVAEIAFHVYAPKFSLRPNQGEGESFTERDWIYLLKARELLYSFYFYPHQDRPLGTDARFKCNLIYCRPSQPDGKTYRAQWVLGLEGVSVTTDPLDEF